MKEILIAGVVDILTQMNFEASSLAAAGLSKAVNKFMERRIQNARDIALNEMKVGLRSDFQVAEADDLVAIMIRYSRAAIEGTANINLRLMAKVMHGQVVSRSMYASEFLAYADTLSSLRLEEIVYLSTMLRLTKKGKRLPKPEKPNEFFDLPQSVLIQMNKSLIGTDIFPDKESLNSCQTAVQRTGLIRRVTFTMDGSVIFAPSHHLVKLGELAKFEDALREENINLE